MSHLGGTMRWDTSEGRRAGGELARPGMGGGPKDGCRHSPSCFTCPLPDCQYENPARAGEYVLRKAKKAAAKVEAEAAAEASRRRLAARLASGPKRAAKVRWIG